MPNGMGKSEILYKTIRGFPDQTSYNKIEELYTEIFKDADLEFFKQRILEHKDLFSVLVYCDQYLIGFKIGYTYNKSTFYSWIGGVLPKYRQQGIAMKMSKTQEQFARQNGFKKVRTKSMNRYKAMMILNLKNGFNITSVYTNTKGKTKIVFEKRLDLFI